MESAGFKPVSRARRVIKKEKRKKKKGEKRERKKKKRKEKKKKEQETCLVDVCNCTYGQFLLPASSGQPDRAVARDRYEREHRGNTAVRKSLPRSRFKDRDCARPRLCLRTHHADPAWYQTLGSFILRRECRASPFGTLNTKRYRTAGGVKVLYRL